MGPQSGARGATHGALARRAGTSNCLTVPSNWTRAVHPFVHTAHAWPRHRGSWQAKTVQPAPVRVNIGIGASRTSHPETAPAVKSLPFCIAGRVRGPSRKDTERSRILRWPAHAFGWGTRCTNYRRSRSHGYATASRGQSTADIGDLDTIAHSLNLCSASSPSSGFLSNRGRDFCSTSLSGADDARAFALDRSLSWAPRRRWTRLGNGRRHAELATRVVSRTGQGLAQSVPRPM